MPTRPGKACASPGCPAIVHGGTYCPAHRKVRTTQEYRQDAAKRGNAADRGYDSRWQKARKGYLAKHPLCAEHKRHRALVSANVVDHIIDHKGDSDLFWDVDGNWQSLCRDCHDRKTKMQNKHGSNTRPHIVVVTGPPCSGKTTYVQKHARPGDAVWDWDAVASAIGVPAWGYVGDLAPMLLSWRSSIIKNAEAGRVAGTLWLIAMDVERLGDIEGAKTVVMDTSIDECYRRLDARPVPPNSKRETQAAIGNWFATEQATAHRVCATTSPLESI